MVAHVPTKLTVDIEMVLRPKDSVQSRNTHKTLCFLRTSGCEEYLLTFAGFECARTAGHAKLLARGLQSNLAVKEATSSVDMPQAWSDASQLRPL